MTRTSIVAPDVDYTITNPRDPLYNEDADHPVINERFERSLRTHDAETKRMHRRHRRERQEMERRHSDEIRQNAERARAHDR
jgi:hypothetical protein